MVKKGWVQVFSALIFAIALTAVSSRKRHYARSSSGLRELAERDFLTVLTLQSLKGSLQQESPVLDAVEAYLEDFAASSTAPHETNITCHVEATVRNPLLVFKLVQRVANFLKDMEGEQERIPGLPLAALAEQYEGENAFTEDLGEVAHAILRIHFIYDLNVTDLAAGKIHGTETGTRLTAVDCAFIGVVAKLRGQYALAVEWLTEAQRLAEIDDTVDVYFVQSQLLDIVKIHDDPGNTRELSEAYFFTKPLLSLESMKRGKTQKVSNALYEKYVGKGRNSSYWEVNYWGLCRGANLLTPEASSHLFCWLEFKIHKIYTIGPLKMEFLTRNPDFVQIYDAFSEKQVADIVSAATGLSPVVINATNSTEARPHVLDPIQSSSTMLLKPEDMAEKNLNRKVETMTGLRSTDSSSKEEATVASYMPGGHFEYHSDPVVEPHLYGDKGDRILTFMVYLNNVEAGGQTVFPTAFSAANPAKGSALYWFNLFSDGSIDYSSVHGGCPVLLGEKWIANKWIRYNDQFSVRKCSSNPKERFQVPVNGKVQASFASSSIESWCFWYFNHYHDKPPLQYLPVPHVFPHTFIEQDELDASNKVIIYPGTSEMLKRPSDFEESALDS